MGIGDWGLGIGPNPQSPIPNPQSPIPNPHFNMIKLKSINKLYLHKSIWLNILINLNNIPQPINLPLNPFKYNSIILTY
jgi:hypothetical protein